MPSNSSWRPFRLSESRAHERLMALGETKGAMDMRTAFENNPHRVAELSKEFEGLFVDMSKQRWDKEVFDALQDLAQEADLAGAIADLFGGVKLNTTENRAVLHMALRANSEDAFSVDGLDVVEMSSTSEIGCSASWTVCRTCTPMVKSRMW